MKRWQKIALMVVAVAILGNSFSYIITPRIIMGPWTVVGDETWYLQYGDATKFAVDSGGHLSAIGFSGQFAHSQITPAQITSTQNDYAPALCTAGDVWRVSSNATQSVTGINASTCEGIRDSIYGRQLTLVNIGAQQIVLEDDDAGSSAANRFQFSGDITLEPGYALTLVYDISGTRWRPIGAVHTPDQVGAVTNTDVCQGDGSAVQCNIATLSNLNTALGSSIADGGHFSPTAGISTDHGAGAITATTDFAGTLCGTGEILEDQGASWACITTPTGGAETNTLTTVTTGIAEDQVPVGNTGTSHYETLPNGAVAFNTTTDVFAQAGFSDLAAGAAADAQVDGSLEADEVNPTLGTQTQGNYMVDVTLGAGIGGSHTPAEGSTATITTASGETDFLASGALTCGASTQGKMQVHTTPLQYCDNAATPVLQYAAYGNSSGVATSATALATDPSDCGANTWATTIAASGNLTCSAVSGGAGITDDTVTTADIDDSADTPAEGEIVVVNATTTQVQYVRPPAVCKTMFDSGGLADTDDVTSVHRWQANIIVSEVWCETDTGTATITLEDGSGNDLTTSCTCDNTGDTGNTCTLTGNTAFTDGELLDFVMVTAAGNRLSYCVEYNYDF